MRTLLGHCIYPMAVIYQILSSGDSLGKLKAPLAVLSAYAESEGQTGVAALDGLRRLKSELDSYLLDSCHFSCFYQFVYFICRERGQKNILVSTGIEAWKLVLTGRFRLLDQWCGFVKEHQRHTISEDTWLQVLTFSIVVHEDLGNYDPEVFILIISTGSWPVLIDEFVEYMIRYHDCRNVLNNSVHIQGLPYDSESGYAVDSKSSSICGNSVRVGCKKRWLSSQEEASQVESVNCIAQRLARIPSPLFSKRIRSSYFTPDSESMEVN
ncbi:defective in cullin neddylation protein AAR3-like isoform X2 [Magnolia sinica]|uniref:defective in cullin neddylation protein AAR3-like isoform X2 n=1 Tax=Magnolia sinica TaxID=86752 RepID=UPI00265889AC|nr:defective in cullin neddylation protein AAR3-like isoform X2 [Magnolia sinica]